MYCECVCLFAKRPFCIILKERKNQLFQKTFSFYNTISNDCASTFMIKRNSTVTRYLCYKLNIYRNHDPTYFVDVFVYSETSTLCNDKESDFSHVISTSTCVITPVNRSKVGFLLDWPLMNMVWLFIRGYCCSFLTYPLSPRFLKTHRWVCGLTGQLTLAD